MYVIRKEVEENLCETKTASSLPNTEAFSSDDKAREAETVRPSSYSLGDGSGLSIDNRSCLA